MITFTYSITITLHHFYESFERKNFHLSDDEFIQLLPEKKLTSTDDFFNHSDEERIAIWKKVSELGKLLVEDFQRILDGEVEENLSGF